MLTLASTANNPGTSQNRALLPGSLLFLALLAGCTSPSNTDAIRERTADATAAAKRDAGAIAKGVVEGLERKGPIDINTGSSRQLQSLPGITPELAHAIIASRPYDDPNQLYKRHVLTKPQFNRIRAQIVTNSADTTKPAPDRR